MFEKFADILQVKIRESGQTNKDFAKSCGISKKALNDIMNGIAPSRWITGKICKSLNWDYDPGLPSQKVIPISKKIVKANFKKKPKSPLKASGRFCIRCFFREKIYVYSTVEMAHYTGFRQQLFSKGMGQKVVDVLKCPLCKKCHKRFDEPKERKSLELSEEFLFFIALFISQEFEASNIIIKR